MSPTPLGRYVAHLLQCSVETLDGRRLFHAVGEVQRKGRNFHDAMHNANQLVGNTPRAVCIAVVYEWLSNNA